MERFPSAARGKPHGATRSRPPLPRTKRAALLLAGALLALAAFSVVLPQSAWAQGKSKLKLWILDCGESDVLMPERWAPRAPEDVPAMFVVRCYLLQHARGTLLWGTGLSTGLMDKPEGVVIPNGALRLRVKKSLVDQLKQIGFAPKDITFASMSHMHADHAGNANLFAASTLIIQQEEYDAAFGPDPGKYNFNPDLYGKLRDSQVMKLQGDLDLFGDGSVVILRSPGHTPGHQSLFLELPNTGPLLLSGDLWHFASNREKRRVPIFNFDAIQTLASMKRIEEVVAARHADVLIEHDAAQHAKFRTSPGYLE